MEKNTGRVLVVDDDPDMVDVIGMMLSRRGYEVLEASGGFEAVTLARKEMPDVIFLDIMMPDIDGYEVYRRIRLDPETKGIPVIFVSGKAKPEDVERGMSLGAQGYITKPFRSAELVEKIREAIA